VRVEDEENVRVKRMLVRMIMRESPRCAKCETKARIGKTKRERKTIYDSRSYPRLKKSTSRSNTIAQVFKWERKELETQRNRIPPGNEYKDPNEIVPQNRIDERKREGLEPSPVVEYTVFKSGAFTLR